MKTFNNKYRSQSHRWQFWDYSVPGAYFITTVSYDRKPIFGQIYEGEMILSEAGEIAKNHLINLNYDDLYIDQFVIMPNHIHLIMIIPDCDDTDSEFYQKWIEKNVNNPLNDLGGKNDNPKNNFDNDDDNSMDEFVWIKHVDTIHELYLRGFSQSKSFFHHHFPQTSYRRSVDLPDELKKQYQKIRRKMAIPMAMGKLKHQISKDINVLNNTYGKTNWQPDYYDIIIRNSRIFNAYKNYIHNNPKKWTYDNFF
jgi:REP element-mobilizing transposase RayT